jgi:hypothetical protein
LKKEPVVGEGSALMLERRTGDSRKEVGLRPGGMVMQVDLEIGSLAGDMSLYLAAALGSRRESESECSAMESRFCVEWNLILVRSEEWRREGRGNSGR